MPSLQLPCNAKSDTSRNAVSVPDLVFELRASILGGSQVRPQGVSAGLGSLFAEPETFDVLENRIQLLPGSFQSLLCRRSSCLSSCKPSFMLLYKKQCETRFDKWQICTDMDLHFEHLSSVNIT